MIYLKRKITLKSVLIGNYSLEFNVIKELLNQQGIIYSEINCDESSYDNNDELHDSIFPCVILTDYSKESLEIAMRVCTSETYILKAVDELPLKEIILSLMGMCEKAYLKNNLLEPFLTACAFRLVDKIKKCFHSQNLPFAHKWFWPNFKKVCCVITHDIDTLNNSPTIENLKLSDCIYYPYSRFILKKPYESNIKKILNMESKINMNSSFYFFSNYNQYHKEFIDVLNFIKKEGHEIGLHGSLYSFQNPNLLIKEKNDLDNAGKINTIGERQHTLNFLVPHTWRYQEEAGFEYDLSFYYNDKIGFRTGICHPYHPFDVLNNTKFNLLELPTCFMDWTVIYLGKSLEEIKCTLDALFFQAYSYKGCLIFNFHNMYISKKRYNLLYDLFKYVLNTIAENNASYWTTTAKSCNNWWRLRENASVDIVMDRRTICCNSLVDLPIYIELPEGRVLKLYTNKLVEL